MHLKRTIAIVTLLAFAALSYAAAFPLCAQETPGAVEKAAAAGKPAERGSVLPYVLIGVGAVAVALVLILVVFKSGYDIRGTWDVTYNNVGHYLITFTGTTTSGTFVYVEDPDTATGTYTQNDKNVTWTFEGGNPVYTGAFTGKDTMAGTFNVNTWVAARVSSAAAIQHPASAAPDRKLKQ
jgi:hypothetical protein